MSFIIYHKEFFLLYGAYKVGIDVYNDYGFPTISYDTIETAAEYGVFDFIKYIIEEEFKSPHPILANINNPWDDMETEEYYDLLLIFSSQGNLEAVKYFSTRFGKLRQDSYDYGLEFASECGHLDVIKYFIDEKLSDNLINPLCEACRSGYSEIIRYYINEKEVNINTMRTNLTLWEYDKKTPILTASHYGHPDIVKSLLRDCLSD